MGEILATGLTPRSPFFLPRSAQDYRSEEVGILKSLGQSEDQIEAFVPKTAAERRQKQQESLSEFARMKQDIEILKTEVAKLRGTPWKDDGVDKNRQNEDISSETAESR